MKGVWPFLVLCAALAAFQGVESQNLTANWDGLQTPLSGGGNPGNGNLSADWSQLQTTDPPPTRVIDPWDYGLLCAAASCIFC